MPTIDAAFIDGLLSTPLVLPASLAGALAALFVVFVVIIVIAARRAASGGGARLLVPLTAIAVAAIAVVGLLERMSTNEQMAEQRALLSRHTQLTLSATAPGSALGCLDGAAGEQIETACEKAVFGDAQSAASAVAYVGARLSLLSDIFTAAQHGGSDLRSVLASLRRTIELDRYGIAAHVLAERDGCTAERCAAFAMFQDTGVLKANLKVRAFDTYVSRYAAEWGRKEPAADKQPQVAIPGSSSVASSGSVTLPTGHPVDPRYDFPSAASIPRVSIMNSEPPVPKDHAAGNPGPPPAAAGNPSVPPKRPQAQAATPPAR